MAKIPLLIPFALILQLFLPYKNPSNTITIFQQCYPMCQMKVKKKYYAITCIYIKFEFSQQDCYSWHSFHNYKAEFCRVNYKNFFKRCSVILICTHSLGTATKNANRCKTPILSHRYTHQSTIHSTEQYWFMLWIKK